MDDGISSFRSAESAVGGCEEVPSGSVRDRRCRRRCRRSYCLYCVKRGQQKRRQQRGYHAGLHGRAACVREPDANKEHHIRSAGFPHDVGDGGMLLHHLCATEFIHFFGGQRLNLAPASLWTARKAEEKAADIGLSDSSTDQCVLTYRSSSFLKSGLPNDWQRLTERRGPTQDRLASSQSDGQRAEPVCSAGGRAFHALQSTAGSEEWAGRRSTIVECGTAA